MTSASQGVLPELDDVITALGADLRERIGREWLRRAGAELSTALVSAQVVQGLLLDGAAPDVLDLAARAVVDEVRHARLCREVAERYLGGPSHEPRARPAELGAFGDAPPQVSRLLSLVLHSCISESIATVCLHEGAARCTSPTAKAATLQLLADDMSHARIGWAHLASPHVDPGGKRHISLALPVLLRLGRDAWLGEPRGDLELPEHGVLAAADYEGLVRTALRDLVLTGFAHVGVDPEPGRAWCARHVEGW